MPTVHTHELTPQSLAALDPESRLQTYCGLDCGVTVEVFEEISDLGPRPQIYDFERALQAPYMAMMLKGFAIDELGRRQAAARLREREALLQMRLNQLAGAVWDKPLNPRSPKQLQEFFYGAMKLPEIWLSQKGERKLSTNREALEKLDEYMHARPFVSAILTLREITKQLNVFETEIDGDGRFRTSYNIAGTETGRPSSSENAFGTGGNAQNIAPGLRHVFVADRGYKLAVIDLEQVEARDVGFFCGCLFGDWAFLDACESGDLHTTNAKRIWPELGWPGTPKGDRLVADQLFYRDFTYRDMAKRGSHLSNYSGTAWTASRALKVPLKLMEDFQSRYCRGPEAAYPAIPQYWQWIATELQTKGQLVTPFGRRRHFFGRPGDPTTIREAIAFVPQSTTADRMNLGLWRVWKHQPRCQLLAQTYDSITFQAPDDRQFDQEVARALELIRVELVAPNGRSYVVPGEAKVGWNWGYASPGNPDGLAKWRPGGDLRTRTKPLQRIMHSC